MDIQPQKVYRGFIITLYADDFDEEGESSPTVGVSRIGDSRIGGIAGRSFEDAEGSIDDYWEQLARQSANGEFVFDVEPS
jgi:hypothetical protein